jgi:hypothetical protein
MGAMRRALVVLLAVAAAGIGVAAVAAGANASSGSTGVTGASGASGATGTDGSGAAAPACAGQSAAVLNNVLGGVAREIYVRERASAEVTNDLATITGAEDLRSAVADDSQSMTFAAATRIVYLPLLHIVRLRVVSRRGRVLADIGGGSVLAPVDGKITIGHRVVGSFVMSVQDDRGYKKLIAAIVDMPVEIYRGGQPLMGTIDHPPPAPPRSGQLRLRGIHYTVDAYNVGAFPYGELRVALFVAAPPAALTTQSCIAINVDAVAAIVRRIARGFAPGGPLPLPEHYQYFAEMAAPFSGGPIFVTSPASGYLAATVTPAPTSLPDSGPFSFDGREWTVYSYEPYPPARIYVLVPPPRT